MGIRVHKCIGYGLVDVESTDQDITDHRFHPEGFLRIDSEFQSDRWHRPGFMNFLSTHPRVLDPNSWRENIDCLDVSIGEDWSPYYSIIHQPEYGLSNVVVLVPPTHKNDYIRFDNTLDYMEETQCYGQENRYKIFRGGIYPYNAEYMDDRTGKRLSADVMSFIRDCNELRRYTDGCQNTLIKENDVSALKEGMNRDAIKLGFDHHEHAMQHIYPAIPAELVLMCEYCKLFTDESTIWQLRPMLYVYWS